MKCTSFKALTPFILYRAYPYNIVHIIIRIERGSCGGGGDAAAAFVRGKRRIELRGFICESNGRDRAVGWLIPGALNKHGSHRGLKLRSIDSPASLLYKHTVLMPLSICNAICPHRNYN